MQLNPQAWKHVNTIAGLLPGLFPDPENVKLPWKVDPGPPVQSSLISAYSERRFPDRRHHLCLSPQFDVTTVEASGLGFFPGLGFLLHLHSWRVYRGLS